MLIPLNEQVGSIEPDGGVVEPLSRPVVAQRTPDTKGVIETPTSRLVPLGQEEQPAPLPVAAPVSAEPESRGPLQFAWENLKTGGRQVVGLYKGFKGLAQDLFGDEEGAKKTFEDYLKYEEETARLNPNQIGSIRNIRSASDTGQYIAETVIQQIPMMLPSLVGAIAGASIGTVVEPGGGTVAGGVAGLGIKTFGRKLIQKAIEKQVAKGIERKAAQKIVQKQMGAIAGSFIPAAALNTSEDYIELYKRTGEGHPIQAIPVGSLKGALDTLPDFKIVSKLLGVSGRDLKKSIFKNLGRYGDALLGQAMIEGPTELGQYLLDEISVSARLAAEGKQYDKTWEEFVSEGVDNLVAGSIAGGILSVATEPFARDAADNAGQAPSVLPPVEATLGNQPAPSLLPTEEEIQQKMEEQNAIQPEVQAEGPVEPLNPPWWVRPATNPNNTPINAAEVPLATGDQTVLDETFSKRGVIAGTLRAVEKPANDQRATLADKVGELAGKRVVYFEDTADRGFVLEGTATDDTLFVNTKSKNPLQSVAIHETTHRMEKESPEIYAALETTIIGSAKTESGQSFADFTSELLKIGPYSEADAKREFVARVMGQRGTEAEFWDGLLKGGDRTAIERFVEILTKIVDAVKASVGLGKANTDTDRYLADVQKVRDAAVKALQDYAATKQVSAQPEATAPIQADTVAEAVTQQTEPVPPSGTEKVSASPLPRTAIEREIAANVEALEKRTPPTDQREFVAWRTALSESKRILQESLANPTPTPEDVQATKAQWEQAKAQVEELRGEKKTAAQGEQSNLFEADKDLLQKGAELSSKASESAGKSLSARTGVTFNGVQKIPGEPDMLTFTDPDTKGTFSTPATATAEEVTKALTEMRQRFAQPAEKKSYSAKQPETEIRPPAKQPSIAKPKYARPSNRAPGNDFMQSLDGPIPVLPKEQARGKGEYDAVRETYEYIDSRAKELRKARQFKLSKLYAEARDALFTEMNKAHIDTWMQRAADPKSSLVAPFLKGAEDFDGLAKLAMEAAEQYVRDNTQPVKKGDEYAAEIMHEAAQRGIQHRESDYKGLSKEQRESIKAVGKSAESPMLYTDPDTIKDFPVYKEGGAWHIQRVDGEWTQLRKGSDEHNHLETWVEAQNAPNASEDVPFAAEPADEQPKNVTALVEAKRMAVAAGLSPDFRANRKTAELNEKIADATGWKKTPEGVWASTGREHALSAEPALARHMTAEKVEVNAKWSPQIQDAAKHAFYVKETDASRRDRAIKAVDKVGFDEAEAHFTDSPNIPDDLRTDAAYIVAEAYQQVVNNAIDPKERVKALKALDLHMLRVYKWAHDTAVNLERFKAFHTEHLRDWASVEYQMRKRADEDRTKHMKQDQIEEMESTIKDLQDALSEAEKRYDEVHASDQRQIRDLKALYKDAGTRAVSEFLSKSRAFYERYRKKVFEEDMQDDAAANGGAKEYGLAPVSGELAAEPNAGDERINAFMLLTSRFIRYGTSTVGDVTYFQMREGDSLKNQWRKYARKLFGDEIVPQLNDLWNAAEYQTILRVKEITTKKTTVQQVQHKKVTKPISPEAQIVVDQIAKQAGVIPAEVITELQAIKDAKTDELRAKAKQKALARIQKMAAEAGITVEQQQVLLYEAARRQKVESLVDWMTDAKVKPEQVLKSVAQNNITAWAKANPGKTVSLDEVMNGLREKELQERAKVELEAWAKANPGKKGDLDAIMADLRAKQDAELGSTDLRAWAKKKGLTEAQATAELERMYGEADFKDAEAARIFDMLNPTRRETRPMTPFELQKRQEAMRKRMGLIRYELSRMGVRVGELVKMNLTDQTELRDTLINELITAGINASDAAKITAQARAIWSGIIEEQTAKIVERRKNLRDSDIIEKIVSAMKSSAFNYDVARRLFAEKYRLRAITPDFVRRMRELHDNMERAITEGGGAETTTADKAREAILAELSRHFDRGWGEHVWAGVYWQLLHGIPTHVFNFAVTGASFAGKNLLLDPIHTAAVATKQAATGHWMQAADTMKSQFYRWGMLKTAIEYGAAQAWYTFTTGHSPHDTVSKYGSDFSNISPTEYSDFWNKGRLNIMRLAKYTQRALRAEDLLFRIPLYEQESFWKIMQEEQKSGKTGAELFAEVGRRVGYSAEVNASLYADIEARAQKQGLKGAERKVFIHNELSKLRGTEVNESATTSSLTDTFNNQRPYGLPGWVHNFIMREQGSESPRNAIRFFGLFSRVTANAINYVIESTPLQFFRLVGDAIHGHYEAGQAKRVTWTAEQRARLAEKAALGTFLAGYFVSKAMQSYEDWKDKEGEENDPPFWFTGYGPRNPAIRSTWLKTHTPYSMTVGKKTIKIWMLGPAVGPALMAGTWLDAHRYADKDEKEPQTILRTLGTSTLGIMQFIEDEMPAKALTDLMEVLSSNQDGAWSRYARNQANSLVNILMPIPFYRTVRDIDRGMIPGMGDPTVITDKLKPWYYGTLRNIPWVKNDVLTPARNVFGEPLTKGVWSRFGEAPKRDPDINFLVLADKSFRAPSYEKTAIFEFKNGGLEARDATAEEYDRFLVLFGAALREGVASVRKIYNKRSDFDEYHDQIKKRLDQARQAAMKQASIEYYRETGQLIEQKKDEQ